MRLRNFIDAFGFGPARRERWGAGQRQTWLDLRAPVCSLRRCSESVYYVCIVLMMTDLFSFIWTGAGIASQETYLIVSLQPNQMISKQNQRNFTKPKVKLAQTFTIALQNHTKVHDIIKSNMGIFVSWTCPFYEIAKSRSQKKLNNWRELAKKIKNVIKKFF